MPRKTTPRVKGGRVQKKNNWELSQDPVFLAGTAVAFLRRRPGPAHRHLLRKTDLERFIALLPDWDELAVGLEVVILDTGEPGIDGWHDRGAVALCAWERELWIDYDVSHVRSHQWIIDRLEIPTESIESSVRVCWSEETARAYQLLHIFLHELGHHHDRMSTSSRISSRGEDYAEQYANRYADQIWTAYEAEFGW